MTKTAGGGTRIQIGRWETVADLCGRHPLARNWIPGPMKYKQLVELGLKGERNLPRPNVKPLRLDIKFQNLVS